MYISLLNLEDPILVAYLLNTIDTPSIVSEITCIQSILAALDQDPEISCYFSQIRDPTLPQSDEDFPYLKLFSTDV